MADLQVSPAVQGNEAYDRRVGPIWTSQLIGYIVYNNGTAVVYKKTTDGGQTWGADVAILDPPIGNPQAMAVWYDKWTPGDTGTLIHAIRGGNSLTVAVRYRTLDTATDLLGTERTVIANQSALGYGTLSMVKARNGYLYVVGFNGDLQVAFRRSINAGVGWATRTNVPNPTMHRADLHPGTEADTADVWRVVHKTSTNELILEVYDDSANTWSSTTIASGIAANLDDLVASCTRLSDGHVIVVASDAGWSAVHNVKCYDIASAASITVMANVLTGTRYILGMHVMASQPDSALWVAYVRGATTSTDGKVYYRKSTDGGATWGAEQPYSVSVSTPNLFRNPHIPDSVPTATLGRFMAVWFVSTLNDYYTNFDNAIDIGLTGGGGGLAVGKLLGVGAM